MSDDVERERAKYEALSALVDGYRRERDDAREERDLARERFEHAVQSATRYAVERDEARAEVGRLREMAHDFEAMREDRDSAYRRGAEEMRLACQQWCRAWENNGDAIADALADLRVEDKP